MGQIGALKFSALHVRAHTYAKKDRKMSLLRVKAMMSELEKGKTEIVGTRA
jgi:hypothetical protein